jgi:hypothetical protein
LSICSTAKKRALGYNPAKARSGSEGRKGKGTGLGQGFIPQRGESLGQGHEQDRFILA